MATKALPTWVWTTAGFVPMDEHAREVAAKYKPGDFVQMKPKLIRNIGFHRKAFALLNNVSAAAGLAPETVRKYATVKAGYFETVEIPALGYVRHDPMSWSFENMDDAEFREFFEAVLKVMIEDIVPHIPEGELRQAVEYELVTA